MMEDVCFVSVAFGPAYVEQQDRLKKSILAIYPKANILFFRDVLPPQAKPFDISLYGFKVHAIREAMKTASKVLWLDPAMILMDKIDDLLPYPVVAVKDDHKLTKLCSNRAYEYFGVTPERVEASDWRLVGGSLYFFDFRKEVANAVFRIWENSERDGIFGSQREAASELINGHRNDESCMAMAMYLCNVNPIAGPDIRYCIENNPMTIKRHFK